MQIEITERQKRILTGLVIKKLNDIYMPKGTISVSPELLKRINKQLEYRQELTDLIGILKP